MEIKNVVIAGAGTMGYSMAQIFAKYGYAVTVYDVKRRALDNAQECIRKNVETLIKQGELDVNLANTLIERLAYTDEKDCFASCDIVIESIIEKLEIKKSFYAEISRIVREDAILATNTSGLSINAIAEAVHIPERFIGMHWFNPSHLILLIELIKGDRTNTETAETVRELSLAIRKKPVVVEKDVPGFVANRIQFAVLREALDLVEKGVISKEGMDDVMKYGLGFRYACVGPLEVADFGGLDTFYHISSYLMKDLCREEGVPALLRECFEKGEYGVKSKKGFYDYSQDRDVLATEKRDEKLLKLFNAFYKEN